MANGILCLPFLMISIITNTDMFWYRTYQFCPWTLQYEVQYIVLCLVIIFLQLHFLFCANIYFSVTTVPTTRETSDYFKSSSLLLSCHVQYHYTSIEGKHYVISYHVSMYKTDLIYFVLFRSIWEKTFKNVLILNIC